MDSDLKDILTKALGLIFLISAIVARGYGQSLLVQAAFGGIGGMLLISTNM